MNPLSLRAMHYRTFEELELDLPQGCLAVVGENGTGKSSIVNVIDLCLFGPQGRSLAEDLTDDAASDELEIELTFEHTGDFYRVRRGFSAKGRGKTTLDLERRWSASDGIDHEEGWEPLTRESQKETQEAITQCIGLTRETFRASAFLAQGDGAAFTEAQPRERKAILAEVLGLEQWERLFELVRSDRRVADRQNSELAGRIELLSEQAGDVATLSAAVEEDKTAVTVGENLVRHAERALSEASEKVIAFERAEQIYRVRAAAVSEAGARLRERQAVVDRAEAAKAEAIALQNELSQHAEPQSVDRLEERRERMFDQQVLRREREAERGRYLAEAEDARRQVVTLTGERDRVGEDLRRLTAQARAVDDPATIPHCPTCEQELRGEAHRIAVTRIREAREDADARVAALEGRIQVQAEHEASRRAAAQKIEIPEAPDADQYGTVLVEIRSAREAAKLLAEARVRLALLKQAAAEVTPKVTDEVARLASECIDAQAALAEVSEPEPGARERAQAAAHTANRCLEEARAALIESRADLTRAETALEQAGKVAADLESARADSARLKNELDLLTLLERAYGRDGIPALIVESQAIPQIETEATRLLAELGTDYRVELHTQRALKSGDGLADALDVVVLTEHGSRAYETFSGSEKERINLALRISLAELLAHRRGAESRVLVVDEPEGLDEGNSTRLAELLLSLYREQKFDRVLMASHYPALREAFDQTIEVEKVDGRSRIAA